MPPFVHRVLTKFSSRAQASVRNVLLICILHPNILTPSTELCCELATYTVRNSWENLPVIETGNFNQRKKKRASRGHLFRRFELLFQSSSEVWILRNPRRGSGMRDDPGCGKNHWNFVGSGVLIALRWSKKMTRLRSRTTGMVSWGGTKDESHSIMYLRESTVSDMNAKEILKTNNNLKRALQFFWTCLHILSHSFQFREEPTRREATSSKTRQFFRVASHENSISR